MVCTDRFQVIWATALAASEQAPKFEGDSQLVRHDAREPIAEVGPRRLPRELRPAHFRPAIAPDLKDAVARLSRGWREFVHSARSLSGGHRPSVASKSSRWPNSRGARRDPPALRDSRYDRRDPMRSS